MTHTSFTKIKGAVEHPEYTSKNYIPVAKEKENGESIHNSLLLLLLEYIFR